ncbi:protein FAM71E2 isoform X1 [Zalophus californianus]|uniref:Protein FAM71E2 isoform X1 n=1 Tax=Zalophus californianus TaxID=9704 RepID=A0A6P9FFY5_ZALCA|nr:protein FAM71E2 isoform X1 [Zalophus californianus]
MNRFQNIRRMESLQGPSKWVPTLGELQKTLQKGEYLPLRPLPMFESNFVQVTNQGAPVYVHHRTNRLTMGVAASLPGLVLPDILLIAQPGEGKECSHLILTRMLPLDLAHLYVHDLSAWRLKLRLITGRYYYLELDAPDKEAGFLFDRWIRLINLLHEPATTWAPRTLNTPTMDLAHVVPPASTWRLQAQPQCRRSVMIVKPNFPYKLMASQRQKKTKTLKRRFKSQAVGDSVPLIWSRLEHAEAKQKSAEKSQPKLYADTSRTKIQVSEKPSITIRTIFSIISNTINNTQSSSKGCSSDSEVGTVLGGLVETPVRCISEGSREPSLLGSYGHLDTYLWRQAIGELMDPNSSTLSSSVFCPAPGPPAFPLPATLSFHKHKGEAGHRQRPPLSQKTLSTRAAPSKVPFILDQSKKVSAARAPSQKTSAAPGPSRRAPAAPVAPQKAPVARGPSRKAPPASATSPKAPAVHGPSRKAPPIQALPPKAVSPTLQRRKSFFIPTPSQKAVTSPRQYKMTPDGADFGMVPELSPKRDGLARRKHEGTPQPMLYLGTQEMDVLETRTQRTFMELPFTTTKKQSEEVVISKAREITVDGLKGRGTLEDRVHKKKEKISLDMPGFKSKERGEQQRWLKTQELAIEGGPEEQSRPFSVEGLTLAKMMIMANCKEPPQRPAAVGLPSWLSAPQASAMSTEGTVPFSPRHVSSPEGKPGAVREQSPVGIWVPSLEGIPVGVREQSPVGTWVKGKMHQWAERSKQHWVKELSQDTTGPSEVPCITELEMDSASQSPIPLPASEWEGAPRSPISLTPISKMEAGVSPQLTSVSQEPQEPKKMSDLSPLTTTGLSSEALSPSPLEVECVSASASMLSSESPQ